jgi:DNA-binding NtrC family response regulator
MHNKEESMHNQIIARPYKVLLLDDEPDILFVLKEMLEAIYDNELIIHVKTNPLAALELIEKEQINIVVTDINMPDLPGDVLLRKIKELQSGTEIVILTGDSTLSLCVTCFYDGATAFVRKPFQSKELRMAIDLCISKLDHWSTLLGKTIEQKVASY